MTNIIKKIILMIYIIISGIILFNMYDNDYYSINNKIIYDNIINMGYTDFDTKELERKKYYDDIITKDGKYTFSFYRDYYGEEYEQKTEPEYNYYGSVTIIQNSTGNKKRIYAIKEKLDNYIEFTAKNKIRVYDNIYLDIEKDVYVYKDEDIKIGDRFFYFVVIPFLILFVFNVPCMFIAVGVSFWAI